MTETGLVIRYGGNPPLDFGEPAVIATPVVEGKQVVEGQSVIQLGERRSPDELLEEAFQVVLNQGNDR